MPNLYLHHLWLVSVQVRKFLHRVHVRRQVCHPTLGALPISHARHLELRAHVEENSQLLLVQGIGKERCSDLHKQAQCTLVKHALQHTERQKRHIRCLATLAQLHTDAQLLMNAPGLQEGGTQLAVFKSYSSPIAAQARQRHLAMACQPHFWWQKLLDDNAFDTK
uniref:IQ calmodulin-binding motif-containing protein 1-like n=1 Tax=Myxine glutinosa TaxID=7769 RepID=UPI00358FA340